MWRLSPLLVLVVAAILFAMPGMRPEKAEAKDSWKREGQTITITVNVAVIGADAENKAAAIKQAFELHYNKPGGFKVSCFTVFFKIDVQASNTRVSGRHSVFVVPVDPGDPWVSEAQVPSKPTETDGISYVSDWDDGSTLVHEITHLMGLPDEYTYNDKDRDGKRDYDEQSVPDPNKAPEYNWTDKPPKNGKIDPGEVTLKSGQKASLMAENSGRILDRHAAELLKKHVPPDQLNCGWKGKGSISETPLDDGARKLTRSAEFEFDFEVDDKGKVTGEITLKYDAVLTVENLPGADVGIASFDPEVGGEVTDPNPTRTFALTGTLNDEGLDLEIATPESDRESIEFTIVADPGVSAGLGGGGAFTAPGGNVQIIQIDMMPFTPFAGPATVEEGPDGSQRAEFFEEGDNYTIEWSAELAGSGGEPVGYAPVHPVSAMANGDRVRFRELLVQGPRS